MAKRIPRKKTKVSINEKKLLSQFEKSARRTAKRMTGFIIAQAVEHYIPFGVTGNLAKSLKERITTRDGKIYFEIEAQEHYAKKQHDRKLRHPAQPANRQSFMQFGVGKDNQEKYWTGYDAIVDASPKYALNYLEKPMQFVIQNVSQFLDAFKRNFKN